MNKKDYETIAQIIKELPMSMFKELLIKELTDYFEKEDLSCAEKCCDSKRFNRELFLKQCM